MRIGQSALLQVSQWRIVSGRYRQVGDCHHRAREGEGVRLRGGPPSHLEGTVWLLH